MSETGEDLSGHNNNITNDIYRELFGGGLRASIVLDFFEKRTRDGEVTAKTRAASNL